MIDHSGYHQEKEVIQAQLVPIIMANRTTLRNIDIKHGSWAAQFNSLALMEAMITCESLDHFTVTEPSTPSTVSDSERTRVMAMLDRALQSFADKRRQQLVSLQCDTNDPVLVHNILSMGKPLLLAIAMATHISFISFLSLTYYMERC